MHRRTLLIALTFAAVATALGYGLLGLAAPDGGATAPAMTSTDVDALIEALAVSGTARVIVVEDAPSSTEPSRSSGYGDDEDHDDDEDDDDDDDDHDRGRRDRDDDD